MCESLGTLDLGEGNRISGGIYHKVRIELTYESNYIEGNWLTREQTRGAVNMFCRKCGTKLLDEDIFCNKCGAKVINKDESVQKYLCEENSTSIHDDNLKRGNINSMTPIGDKSDGISSFVIGIIVYLAKISAYFAIYVIFTAMICFFKVPSDMFKEFLTDTRGLWAVCFQYIGEAIFFEVLCIPLLVWIKKLKDKLCIFEFLFIIALFLHVSKLIFGEHFMEGTTQLIICAAIFIIGMGLLLLDKRLDKLMNGRKETASRKMLYALVPLVLVTGVLFHSSLMSVDSLDRKEDDTQKLVNSQPMERKHDPGIFVKLGDTKDGILVNVGDGRFFKTNIVIELNPRKKEVVVNDKLTEQAEARIFLDVISILKSADLENFNADMQDHIKKEIMNTINQNLGNGTVYDVYITSITQVD